MIVLRATKVALVAAIALYATIVTFGNLNINNPFASTQPLTWTHAQSK